MGFGGAERVCNELMSYYAKHNVNVTLHLYDMDSLELLSYHDNINVKKYTTIRRLAKALKGQSVIIFNYPQGIKGIILSRLFRYHTTYVMRHATFLYRLESPDRNQPLNKRILLLLYYNFYLRFIKLYEKHIVLNETMKRNLVRRFKIKEEKISVIPNPINQTFLEAQPLKPTVPNILYVGRLLKSKGLLDLLAIRKELPSHWKLTIIGNGHLKIDVLKAQKTSIGPEIIYHEATADILDFYKNASCVVLPSYREGSPNVLLEAIAVGKPVVAYDCLSGPKDIIVPNVNGLLVPLGDKQILKESLVNAVEKNWSEFEIKNTVQSHRIHLIAEKYLGVLKS